MDEAEVTLEDVIDGNMADTSRLVAALDRINDKLTIIVVLLAIPAVILAIGIVLLIADQGSP